MKKHSILVLVLLGALSLGCMEEIPEVVVDDNSGSVIPGMTGNPVTLTTTVSLGGGPESKALTAEGVKTFAVGDRVAIVYTNTADATVKAVSEPLSAGDIRDGGKTANLTVALTDPKPSGAVTYIYPAAMAAADGSVNYAALAAQDGSLASLAAGLDLCTYSGTLTSSASLPLMATLDNRLAIGEFIVKDESSDDITSSVVSLTVSDGANTYSVSRSAGPGPIYVAMRPVDNANLTFCATDASNGYEKSATGKTLAAGSMYPIDLKMAKSFDSKATPLTFEAIGAGTVTYMPADASMKVQYSKNGGDWHDYDGPVSLAADETVAFRGKNATYRASSGYSQFVCSADCYLYGNIMSLVTDYSQDPNAFAGNVTLTADKTFYRMFDDSSNQHIKSHASKPIVLPATTLTEACYSYLFEKTGLTSAPVLSATTLTDDCYEGMFAGCTNLTAAPALPATVLADRCYNSMFYSCTSLTAAPALPATVLASQCYEGMFQDCISLTAAPALPATVLADCCYGMMFYGCTSLTAAPVLPATLLTNRCYEWMFSGCSQLNSITCYAVDISAGYCTENWLYGVPAGGTFRIHPALNPSYPTAIAACIPNGWTVENYPVATKALAEASWEDVGRVVGADGNIYTSSAQATAAGTKAEAVIAYMGTVEGVCSHGLALALEDASSSATFAEATGESLISGWAASHSVPGGTWRLPSARDWQYLCMGTYNADLENHYGLPTCINSLLSNAGGYSLLDQVEYWSSTPVDEDRAWDICYYAPDLNNNNVSAYIVFESCYKTSKIHVRACLSF